MVSIRTSVHRWRSLSGLLAALERVLEGTARLDAYDRADEGRGRPCTIGPDVCARLEAIEARIDREVDRLTAELLAVQLLEKQQRDRSLV
jgi:hypothetical protein